MPTRVLPWLLLVPLAGCARCAGSGAPDAGRAAVHRSSDLRSGYNIMFPEYRGARIVSSRATLTRVYAGDAGDLHQRFDGAIKAAGFTVEDSGPSLLAHRPPWVFEAAATAQGAQLTVWLDVKEDDVGKAMMAPASLSTDSMALWFPPTPAGLRLEHEDYELSLRWQAAFDERPWFLIRQLVSGATASGWQLSPREPFVAGEKLPDGGAAPIPDPLDLELSEPHSGTRLAVHREGRLVTVRYLLRTLEP